MAPPEAKAHSGTYQGRIMGDDGRLELDFLANSRLRGMVLFESGERRVVTGSYTLGSEDAATIMLMEQGDDEPAVYSGTVREGKAEGRVTIGRRSKGKFSVER